MRVTAGQERLVGQQQQLQSNYEDVQRSISFGLRGNVRALNHEKVLIDNGRRQLKEMAKTVKEKLGKDMYNVGRFIDHLYQKQKVWVNPLKSSRSEHTNVRRLPATDASRVFVIGWFINKLMVCYIFFPKSVAVLRYYSAYCQSNLR